MDKQSGVYEILNLVNGKRYIGSAVCFKKRWKWHRTDLRRGDHHNAPLQAAWTKYGPDVFLFKPILTCQQSMLKFYEQQLLDKVLPEYNCATAASNPMLGRKHSAETKAKISAANLGSKRSSEARPRMSAACKGRVISVEARGKLSAALLGRKKPPRTDEWKRKQAEAHRGQKNSPEAIAKTAAGNRGQKRTPEQNARQVARQLGQRRSAESIARMCIAARAREARRKAG